MGVTTLPEQWAAELRDRGPKGLLFKRILLEALKRNQAVARFKEKELGAKLALLQKRAIEYKEDPPSSEMMDKYVVFPPGDFVTVPYRESGDFGFETGADNGFDGDAEEDSSDKDVEQGRDNGAENGSGQNVSNENVSDKDDSGKDDSDEVISDEVISVEVISVEDGSDEEGFHQECFDQNGFVLKGWRKKGISKQNTLRKYMKLVNRASEVTPSMKDAVRTPGFRALENTVFKFRMSIPLEIVHYLSLSAPKNPRRPVKVNDNGRFVPSRMESSNGKKTRSILNRRTWN